jgi:hypothetical protein
MPIYFHNILRFKAPINGKKAPFSPPYRFNFNGMKRDVEVNEVGNSLNFKYRVEESKPGRFLSVNTLYRKYSYNANYSFYENASVWCNDLEGAELNLDNTGRLIIGPLDIKVINKQNIKKYPTEVAAHLNSLPATLEELSVVKLQFKTEAEAQLGVTARIIGFGSGVSAGISKPITTATYSGQVFKGVVGGQTATEIQVSYGNFSLKENINEENKPLIGIEAGPLAISLYTGDKAPQTKLIIFNLKANFIIGGSISLSINVPMNPRPVEQPEGRSDYTNCSAASTSTAKPPSDFLTTLVKSQELFRLYPR